MSHRKKRRPITPRMKVDALLHRVFLQFGAYLKDPTGANLRPGDDVVFDHVHPVTFDGPHEYENLRPTLRKTNAEKGNRETKAAAKVRRIRGETKRKRGPRLNSSSFVRGASRKVESSSFARNP